MHFNAYRSPQKAALRDAIREYDANKWKVIGQKVGKPAKVCWVNLPNTTLETLMENSGL